MFCGTSDGSIQQWDLETHEMVNIPNPDSTRNPNRNPNLATTLAVFSALTSTLPEPIHLADGLSKDEILIPAP